MNTGVVVWGREHARLWEPPARPLPPKLHVAEQCWVQCRVREEGYAVAKLDRKWNHQWWSDRKLEQMTAAPPHVLHLAGLSQMDAVSGWKLSAAEVRSVVLAAAAWAAG